MKKARRIKAGVLAFTAVVSVAVTSVPVYAVEDSPVVYDLKAEQKNQENLEYDQAALDLLKYCNKDDFKTWDQSLAPMNDAQAQEIKTFVDDQIVKGETEDYKDLFMIGLQKTYGMQDQMIQISDLLRMMCLRRKWLCAEVIQICIKRCLMRQVFRQFMLSAGQADKVMHGISYMRMENGFILILHGEFPILTTILLRM
jgi:hypothetical protein